MDNPQPHHDHNPDRPEGDGGTITRDPVCGMIVDPHAGKPTASHAGHTYHFCSQGCRTKFVSDPESFVTATDPVTYLWVVGLLALVAFVACALPALRATRVNPLSALRYE